MTRKYDYACTSCDHTMYLEMTLSEYSEYTLTPVCSECGGKMARSYKVNIPQYRMLKGCYNSTYDGRKEGVEEMKRSY